MNNTNLEWHASKQYNILMYSGKYVISQDKIFIKLYKFSEKWEDLNNIDNENNIFNWQKYNFETKENCI